MVRRNKPFVERDDEDKYWIMGQYVVSDYPEVQLLEEVLTKKECDMAETLDYEPELCEQLLANAWYKEAQE